MNARPHCTCENVRCFDYAEAAALLRCKRSWLEDNISSLPHQKRGASPAFCPCELALIQAMTTVLPAEVLALLALKDAQAEQQDHRPVSAISTLTPSKGRGRGRVHTA